MATFYAKYPATTVAVSGTSTVQGPGTAGTQSGGVLTVQGDPAGTPIPITGSISATNPSVGATGIADPASATYIGLNNGGTLIGAVADSSGRIIAAGAGGAGTPAGGVVSIQGVGSGTAVPISGAVTVTSGTVAATQSGTWTVQPGNTANTTAWKVDGSAVTQPISGTVSISGTSPVSGTVAVSNLPTTSDTNLGSPGASTLRVAAMVGVGSTAVSNANPLPVTQSSAAVTWQAEGSIAFGSMTTSFATALTVSATLVWVGLRNNTNGIIVVSLDSGTTSAFTLDPGDQVSLDLKCQNKSIAAAVTIQAKYTGSAPTSGTFRVNGYS